MATDAITSFILFYFILFYFFHFILFTVTALLSVCIYLTREWFLSGPPLPRSPHTEHPRDFISSFISFYFSRKKLVSVRAEFVESRILRIRSTCTYSILDVSVFPPRQWTFARTLAEIHLLPQENLNNSKYGFWVRREVFFCFSLLLCKERNAPRGIPRIRRCYDSDGCLARLFYGILFVATCFAFPPGHSMLLFNSIYIIKNSIDYWDTFYMNENNIV